MNTYFWGPGFEFTVDFLINNIFEYNLPPDPTVGDMERIVHVFTNNESISPLELRASPLLFRNEGRLHQVDVNNNCFLFEFVIEEYLLNRPRTAEGLLYVSTYVLRGRYTVCLEHLVRDTPSMSQSREDENEEGGDDIFLSD